MTDPGRPRALLLEGIHPNAVTRLESEGYAVEALGRALDEDELTGRLAGVHLLGIRSKTAVRAAALKAAPDLVAVGAFCIGTDQVDLAAAAAAGVPVFNAPFSNTRSVVELAVAEIIALTRRLTEKNAAMHAGVWDKAAEGSHEVRGRNLGIVGYGNIGTQLSVLAENLGMRVYFYDTADRLALGNAHRCDTLDELLGVADVVTLHVDGRPGNSGFFGAEQFARMRSGSLFLNLSRGFVIDHAALRRHLDSGHVAGAAVDVFPAEPKGQRHPDPAHRRFDRGGAGRHRLLRGEQAGPVRRRGGHHAEREPAAGGDAAAARYPPAGARPPQHPRRPGRGEQHPGRAPGQHRGPGAGYPRRGRVPADRHRHAVRRRRGGPAARDGADDPAAGPSVSDLFERLREIVGDAHVLVDPDLRAPYETDWTRRFTGTARCVVRPADTAEVAGVVAACAAAGTPIVVQGGNTGPVDPVEAQVTAGAGVTLERLQEHARAAGLDFGVDLAARSAATVGGLVATNAGGIRVLRYGSMRAQVTGLEAVLADGTVVSRLSGLAKDNTGYDLTQLLVGSEGTLGVVTRARLRLVPLLPARAVALVGLATTEDALALLARARGALTGLAAAELCYADGVALVRSYAGLPAPFPEEYPVYLVLECAARSDPTDELVELLGDAGEIGDATVASDAAGRTRLWAYREAHTEAISAAGIPVKLDVSVPLRELASLAAHKDQAIHRLVLKCRLVISPAQLQFPDQLAQRLLDSSVDALCFAGDGWINRTQRFNRACRRRHFRGSGILRFGGANRSIEQCETVLSRFGRGLHDRRDRAGRFVSAIGLQRRHMRQL